MTRKILLILCCASPVGAVTCPSGYTYWNTLTIDKSKVPNTDQIDFPVLISTTVPNLKTAANGGHVQNSSGYDIVFSTDANAGRFLYYSTETYTATTGKLEYWVRVSTVSTASNTTIYIFYGNSGVSTFQSFSTSTWNNNYKIVQHWRDASTLHLGDDTATATVATNASATAGTGQIDGGVTTGVSAYVSDANGSNAISGDDTQTVSMWVKGTTFANTPLLWSTADNPQTKDAFMQVGGTVIYQGYRFSVSTSAYAVWNADITDGGWHLLHEVKTGVSSGQLYLDGAACSLNSGSIENMPVLANLPIVVNGLYNAIPTFNFNGTTDEFRVMSSAITADWAMTEYNNQKNPNSFFSYGLEQLCNPFTINFKTDGLAP